MWQIRLHQAQKYSPLYWLINTPDIRGSEGRGPNPQAVQGCRNQTCQHSPCGRNICRKVFILQLCGVSVCWICDCKSKLWVWRGECDYSGTFIDKDFISLKIIPTVSPIPSPSQGQEEESNQVQVLWLHGAGGRRGWLECCRCGENNGWTCQWTCWGLLLRGTLKKKTPVYLKTSSK